MIPHVVIVGADKGGVGKTFLSRALLSWFQQNGLRWRAVDTQMPDGNLKRFAPSAEVIDLSASDGQMKVFDTLKPGQITLIDCQAGALSATLRTLDEVGFLEGIAEGRRKVTLLHIIGSTVASFDEIRAVSGLARGARHYLVQNHINGATFAGFSEDLRGLGNGVVTIGKLDELAAEHVDAAGQSFADFIADERHSEFLRGYVRAWLRRCGTEFDRLKLKEET